VQPALTAPTTENTDENKLVRRRKRFPLGFILGGIAILAAVIYLISANTQANAVYYMTVKELRSCTTCTTQSVRVAGTVQAGSVVRDDQKQLITFAIADG
jgi:cytochrome c-type biogenesis protein CcmE